MGYNMPDRTWMKKRASNEEAQRFTPIILRIILGIIITKMNTTGFNSGFAGRFSFVEPEKGIKKGHTNAPSSTPKKLNRLIVVTNGLGRVPEKLPGKKSFKIKSK